MSSSCGARVCCRAALPSPAARCADPPNAQQLTSPARPAPWPKTWRWLACPREPCGMWARAASMCGAQAAARPPLQSSARQGVPLPPGRPEQQPKQGAVVPPPPAPTLSLLRCLQSLLHPLPELRQSQRTHRMWGAPGAAPAQRRCRPPCKGAAGTAERSSGQAVAAAAAGGWPAARAAAPTLACIGHHKLGGTVHSQANPDRSTHQSLRHCILAAGLRQRLGVG